MVIRFLILLLFAIGSAFAESRPNIVIIFTDDQGYADLGCYGNTKNKTPRLDQLAKEGTRYTSFYTQAVCGPSRSALLTGRYPHLSKGWGMPANETTWAELIKEAGYQTACIGKWDVSNRKPIIERMPNAQGFDYFYGALGANDSGKMKFHLNNEAAGATSDMAEVTRLYTDWSIDFLENKRDRDKPFVLYLAHTMMHTIVDASPQFRGKSDGGLYGDVVEEFDHETGRLLDKLDELELSENTLVIYTTDNGPWNQPKYYKRKKGHPEGSIFWGESGPLRNGKGSCYEGGYRAACIVRWPGKVASGVVSDSMWATIDLMPTFANLAGFEVPTDRVIDGIDQTQLLFGKTQEGRDSFFFEGSGIRMGKWKYLKADAKFASYAVESDRESVEELYDLDADLGEQTNLASAKPQIVAKLKAAAEVYFKRKRELPEQAQSDSVAPKFARLAGRIEFDKKVSYSEGRSPLVAGKSLTLSATVTQKGSGDGVIVAQGGSLVGYTLFIREDRVVFAVRSNKKLIEVVSEPVTSGSKLVISAVLSKTGEMTLVVDGVRQSTAGHLLKPEPKIGLSVGDDQGPNIAKYRGEKFAGDIENLVLEVD